MSRGGLFDIPRALESRVCSPRAAAALIPEGAVVVASGYTAAGDPKATLTALAERGRAGDICEIDLITAAQLSSAVEGALAEAGILRRRAPFTVAAPVRQRANRQELRYVEAAMGKMPRLFAAGAFGVPDVAVVEALGIQEDGGVILTSSVGMTPLLCRMAKRVIIEINTAQPPELWGLHDLYESPRHTGAAPASPGARLGGSSFFLAPEKIAAVVWSDRPDQPPEESQPNQTELAICRNLQEFLEKCYPGSTLPPIQTGIGGLSQAILASFGDSRYRDLEFFCGALQEGMLELLARGKAKCLSGGSVVTTPAAKRCFQALGPELSSHLVLRGMEVSNGAAAAAGLGILALNTGIEMDLFGNVNASHIGGNKVVNGIGGGAGFASNAALSVMMLPSVRKDGDISCFVPQTPHVDVIHHDVDLVVSEQGVADLRGKDDVECAREILTHCVHPSYRQPLEAALAAAMKGAGHHPVLLDGAFAWHRRLQETGTMREL